MSTHMSRLAALACIIVLSAGCVGYRLGSTLPSDIKSVHVPPFVNKTMEPQLESETTQAAIREFQKDGTLMIETAENAGSILEVNLIKYELESLRYDKTDVKKTDEYRLKIHAELVFRRPKAQKVLAKQTVVGETTFLAGTDLPASKKAALPKAAQDLGRRIVQAVVEVW